MIYIIIPVFNRWYYTKPCLESLINQSYSNFKIIVVDHGSSDGTGKFISELFSDIIVLYGDESMWWAAATNVGVQYALENNADYILTLNNDLIVENSYLNNLIASVEEKSIIGSISLDINNPEKIAFAGTQWKQFSAKYSKPVSIDLPYYLFKEKHSLIKSDLLPGRGTLIPRSVFTDIGLFNELDFPHYMADEEFSWRARQAGYSLWVCSNAPVYSHIEATGLKTTKKNKLRFLKESFTSVKSPNNLKIRWKWSQKTKFPILYFFIDVSRTFLSLLLKSV